ncbi:MAG: type II secretion system major pseudopilin GspG [Candidatus Schekmanbacteria bacterium]|nr:type II secretion system major pseudopilin GspG [Candidatus Schekmanbacteria bacterium]
MKKSAVKRRFGNDREAGFSLIEIMVVVMIMGLLGALVGPAIFDKLSTAKCGTAKSQIKNLKAALDQYRLDCDKYPDSLQGLLTSTGECWSGPYLADAEELPVDPWGQAYTYEVDASGKSVRICPGSEKAADCKEKFCQ